MTKNVGKRDALLRFALVIVIMAMIFQTDIQSPLAIILIVIAGILFTTAATKRCMVYNLFEISTREKETDSSL